ncbi:MAG TPA: hypothetical protein VHF89_10605 [Solirubrobacteraceae bacterium]|nr:hypothetical protein [Solirubrobacteraceae bacterium]
MSDERDLDLETALGQLTSWRGRRVLVAVRTAGEEGPPVVEELHGTLAVSEPSPSPDDDVTAPAAFSLEDQERTFALDPATFTAARMTDDGICIDLGRVSLEVTPTGDDAAAGPQDAGADDSEIAEAVPPPPPEPSPAPAPHRPEPTPATPLPPRRTARGWIVDHLVGGVIAGLLSALILLVADAVFGPLFEPESQAPPDRPTTVERRGPLDGRFHVRILTQDGVVNSYVVEDRMAHHIPSEAVFVCLAGYYPVQCEVGDDEFNRRVTRGGANARCPAGVQPKLRPQIITDEYVLREGRREGKPTPMWLLDDGRLARIRDRGTFECLARLYLLWDFVSSGEIATFPKTAAPARCPRSAPGG